MLPLLATHLSFREIGSHFYVSHNTVKTQAISAYRKLGASNRSEAVQQAEKLGLIGKATDGVDAPDRVMRSSWPTAISTKQASNRRLYPLRGIGP